MSAISKVQVSVEQLHGDTREQTTKYSNYNAWLDRKSMRRFPMPAQPATQSDDAREYEARFGIPL
jgi:phosphoribosylanthranilate isomerase